MELCVKEMTCSDYDAFAVMLVELNNYHAEGRPDLFIKTEDVIYTKEKFEKMINDPNYVMLMAYADEKKVGFAITVIKEKLVMVTHKNGIMEELFVDREYRRRGIGRLLYNETVERLNKKGIDRLMLTVWSLNPDAIRFYRALNMNVQRFVMEQEI
ncbi:MAG: GNAT family N-acetyltransferase [Lachnospiraceae bacterium]|nr:GNAT family N-acetyltransferase [Lachnospiraceae bacterium]